ncbi:MAG: amylo-alpha-1,6-glucosidase [Candidatus Thiodiazotropha lotti]|uniref:Glycogen debranching protein n=1 Tax=Candidatus Thiodiazotropha endoloripes TaxID=1818881 RepID=A0A1E2USA6_9GAMM|nr:amylo-alpha-1,6-glucosidase [Candidatus Thiodiazotropha endoloripes]MCG7898819.1 amylo-alpha-1,6-glucosidase [Candidatus Thiodiazotropha weberae]MCG7932351.1 amylo-alpha-1,6-glucosidase [Candidatus Thiodiazotropha lotti]MCG7904269.1 amylo-alpha-1,6-glucosidase [Candidatus Thiodiazotropha weberae]MCG7913498.1 amylo-alpha-1,6-glucosidase [Candidatus Thiodiazotropha weberae]MCG7999779.1 amylo-alpha-1,6-glucosidase [Candidatus Thiodiazotropha lotti]
MSDLIRFGRDICGDLAQAERREWWLTNGLGGYAGGTIAGTLTRRYHGLLIAPLQGAMDRQLLMTKADATLDAAGREWPLFTNRWYGDVVQPSGYRNIEHFRLHGRMPVWRFACAERIVEMRIWMVDGEHTTYVAYRCSGGGDEPARLRLKLLVNHRDHHGNMPVRGTTAAIKQRDDRLEIEWPQGGRLYLHSTPAEMEPRQDWHEGFQLNREAERGLAAIDNNLSLGQLIFTLRDGEWVGFAVTLNDQLQFDLPASMQRFMDRDERLRQPQTASLSELPDWVAQMRLSADSFLIKRVLPSGELGDSIIAGYPWFGDWGRDTMISLTGLTLAVGRLESARSILMSYAKLVDQGQLPNRFTDRGETAEYNTVDAALWYFDAWRAYLDASDDMESLQQIYPVLQSIIDWHIKGTRYGIGMDPQDNLLRAGEAGVQLTWMDAKVGNWVVTPRTGKAVEINALWYNGLMIMAGFAKRLDQSATEYAELAEAVKASFKRFNQPDGEGLYDLLDGPDGDDSSIRPNQILAVSLPHSPLEAEQQKQVVEICSRELLTSHGLRSLSPRHKDYAHHYRGGVADRDGAYHQGTVWAWLLGHYAWAEYLMSGDALAAQQRLQPLGDHLKDAGLGHVSEIFDADPPHQPRGAPAQAWSVATTLDAWQRLQRIIDGQ